MISGSIRRVRYNPEIRVEGVVAAVIPAGGGPVTIEELRNISGVYPEGKVAVLGLQAAANPSVMLEVHVDMEIVNELNSAGLSGTAYADTPVYFEASKSLVFYARNLGATDVTNYPLRYTWLAWKPLELQPLVDMPLIPHERWPTVLPYEAMAAVERCFKTVRKEIHVFYGDVTTTTPSDIASILNTRPGEYLVLEEIAGDVNANVNIMVFREGETEAGLTLNAGFLPANKAPLKLWLPAVNELRVSLLGTATVTGYTGVVKVRRVAPTHPEVPRMCGLE